MIYLGPVIVLLIFVAVLLLLFVIATWSLRKSWYASAACLLITGLIATYLTSLHSATTDRLQRLLKSLAMPAGNPVSINPTTSLALLQNSICKGFTSRIHAVRRVA